VLSFIGMLVVGGLDRRFGWSSDIVVEKDQPLVTTGLYGIVRHPMYSALWS
jgi:protein-S-isoprenylcysteine O-methyltransferase Ste14